MVAKFPTLSDTYWMVPPSLLALLLRYRASLALEAMRQEHIAINTNITN